MIQKNRKISIALLGDIALMGLISEEQENNPARYSAPAKILQLIDLPIANLEVPVKAGNEFNEKKDRYYFADADATRQVLQLLNIQVVSIANNHIFDLKMSGLIATIQLLDEMGIQHTGAGWKEEHIQPVILKLKEKTIAFLAYVDQGTNPKTETFPELLINYFSIDNVCADLQKLKDTVDLAIVSIHWGLDYSFYPTQTQRELAIKIINSGADIIMGHHPHTLQPFEVIDGKYIFYSLGGLTFGDLRKNGNFSALFRKTKKSVIAEYDIQSKTASFHATEELLGNTIKITNRNYIKWSEKIWNYFKLKNSSKLMNKVIMFHDTFFFRIHEYFFGYYKNPLKRLLQIGNLKKIPRLFGDYKRNTTKKL